MKAIFDHSTEESENTRTFWFKPEHELRYTAGQFTELTLPHAKPDDRGIKRWFTLSSPPGGDMVSITTKYAGAESSSFKKTLFKLETGQEVDIADAMGDFVLPKLTQTPIVFVAGGIGLTPMHSMAGWLTATGEQRDIRFLYAVTSEDDIVLQADIEKSGIKPVIVVSDPSPSWGGERGHLSAELILGIEKPSDDTLIYLSGPEPMLEALESDLLKHGVSQRQLVTDFFPGYKII